MAELHEALTSLAPTEWENVPTDSLDNYLADMFTHGELICNSVPPPVSGIPFQDAKPQYDKPNQATGWKDMQMSSARAHPSPREHEALQKNWGKAMKFSQKENPLGIAVYKMAGHDRHGAWFARRSVHEGMGFNKFRHAMIREFPESLAVQGGPGEGNIRGIGGDQRLERKDIEGVGRLEVYQLSAQFPGPTTPREFITLLLTTDHAMSEKSAQHRDGDSHVPRSYMIVSKPIKHPEAPERSGYIRGQYESVELVREIPLSPSKSKSTNDLLNAAQGSGVSGRDRGSTIGFAESRGPDAKGEQRDLKQGGSGSSDDAELNPIEWIMITRSDPGGGIPRFMVDRGTPSALISDVHKWLDWAANLDETQDPEAAQPAEAIEAKAGEASEQTAPSHETNTHPKEDSGFEAPRKSATMPTPSEPQQQEGVISHISQAFGAGIDQYAPVAVSSYMHGDSKDANIEDDSSSDASSISSTGSFMSASSMRRLSTAPNDTRSPADSQVSLGSMSPESIKHQKSLNNHEKEVFKLAKRRDTLDRKLAKKREEEEAKLAKAKDQEDSEKTKAQERYERELQKSEAKHRREREKLKAKKEKESRKAEEKRRKRDDRDNLSRVARERDEFREQVGLLKREVDILHDQLGDLQRENTALASRVGKLGGPDALRGVREEIGGRGRSSSDVSVRSRGSGESKRAGAGGA